ncbi:potassium channel family protein [Psychromicrobium sp. YIM B11713]|uniref:potassium channel family protein n=1 Tax=Psychromicrobium sp. YIM B11713 TaxID=3145233 RepID=UPI00374E7EEB
MLTAALLFLVAYSIQVIANLQPDQAIAIEIIIAITWVAFAVDYIVALWLAPRRGRWFLRNLHELVILILPALRPLRLLRLLTLIRILQRSGGNALRGRVVSYVLVSATLLIYAGALAVLDSEENTPGSNITNIWDALWWAVTTITTVGYGDHYPITAIGRLVAVGLMIGGIAVLGVVTASFASWLVEQVAVETEAEAAAAEEPLREQVALLGQQIELLRKELEKPKNP